MPIYGHSKTVTYIHKETLSQAYLERQKNGTILFNLVNFTMYFHIFGEKSTFKVTKKLHFLFKRGF